MARFLDPALAAVGEQIADELEQALKKTDENLRRMQPISEAIAGLLADQAKDTYGARLVSRYQPTGSEIDAASWDR